MIVKECIIHIPILIPLCPTVTILVAALRREATMMVILAARTMQVASAMRRRGRQRDWPSRSSTKSAATRSRQSLWRACDF
jgi:hypothetical protein